MEYYDSNDRLVEVEERDECNTCGRTEYMCPGHEQECVDCGAVATEGHISEAGNYIPRCKTCFAKRITKNSKNFF